MARRRSTARATSVARVFVTAVVFAGLVLTGALAVRAGAGGRGAGPTAAATAAPVGSGTVPARRPAPSSRPAPSTHPAPSTRPAAPARPPVSVHQVVGLGDSVPAGTACGCRPYIPLVADALARAQHTAVSATNLAVPGEGTPGLLAQLDRPGVAAAVRSADLVIVTIGANDFDGGVVAHPSCAPDAGQACYRRPLAALRTRLDDVVARLRALLTRPGARIVVTGYWNVFRDGHVGRTKGAAYMRNSDALTRAVDAVVAATARRRQATYVDVYAAFKGDGDRDDTSLLAADGDHPSAAGHRIIAEAIAAALAIRG